MKKSKAMEINELLISFDESDAKDSQHSGFFGVFVDGTNHKKGIGFNIHMKGAITAMETAMLCVKLQQLLDILRKSVIEQSFDHVEEHGSINFEKGFKDPSVS